MDLRKYTAKTIATYAAPVFAALAVRVVMFFSWIDSPFRSYHTLVGLDMRKFLLWGTGLAEGRCRFTAYRFFVAVVSLFVDPANLADGVVAAQLALGVLATGLTVFIFRSLFRERFFAILAGFLFALYAPPLLYETHILKETVYLFLTTLSLVTAIFVVSKRGTGWKWFFICGMSAIMPFLTRFSGVLWFVSAVLWIFFVLRRRKESLKPLFAFICGGAVVLAAVFAFEFSLGRSPKPFFTPNAAYVLSVGAKPELSDLSVEDTSEASAAARGDENLIGCYAAKIPYIFSGLEMPNNVNYYFERLKLFPLNLTVSPGFLVPLGFAGLILMFFVPGFRGRAIPFLWLFFSFAVPMMLFVPLARYKLVLAPMFCVSASFLAMMLFRGIRGSDWNRVALVAGMGGVCFLFSAIFAPPPPVVRDGDWKAYAMVVLKKPVELMTGGDFKSARAILSPLVKANPENPYIRIEYVSSLLGTGASKSAYFVLKGMGIPGNSRLAARYLFERGEAARLLSLTDEAVECYRRAKALNIDGFRGKATDRWLEKLSGKR
ncbi:MAG: hypothetical protein GXP32_08760 [Kiritimatiellaeota bacterium]|nr:hypothetical protein [Kiritimatiellota bacterium]